MKIIDVNLSLGGQNWDGRELTAEAVLQTMAHYRIDRAVCFHQHALLDPKDGNEKMARLFAASGSRLGICAVLDPVLGAENLPGTGTLLQRLEAFEPECLRIFPAFVRLPFHPFYWEEILTAANELALPLIVDTTYDEDFFSNIPAVAAAYPRVKFILIREGCCQSRRIFPLLTGRHNVYFTIERMLDHLQLEEITARCGCDRLLFGSGFPERPHSGALGLALYADIPEAARAQILSKNWEAITT